MAQQRQSRKARFRAALALAGMNMTEWCEQEGYSMNHLYLYFRGDRPSPPLDAKIDTFIAEHLPAHAA
jgi:hypothetical protein